MVTKRDNDDRPTDRQGEYRAICLWEMDWQSFAIIVSAFCRERKNGCKSYEEEDQQQSLQHFHKKVGMRCQQSRVPELKTNTFCWKTCMCTVLSPISVALGGPLETICWSDSVGPTLLWSLIYFLSNRSLMLEFKAMSSSSKVYTYT